MAMGAAIKLLEDFCAMGLCKTLYNHVYPFWSKVEYINWHHSVNSCPIFIIFFLFCWYFQAASIYCKNEAENQLENFGFNPLLLCKPVLKTLNMIMMVISVKRVTQSQFSSL